MLKWPLACSGALVLLTQAADAVGAQHQGGKDTCQGELALVPCPFQEDRLVELNASIQDDVLQVRASHSLSADSIVCPM